MANIGNNNVNLNTDKSTAKLDKQLEAMTPFIKKALEKDPLASLSNFEKVPTDGIAISSKTIITRNSDFKMNYNFIESQPEDSIQNKINNDDLKNSFFYINGINTTEQEANDTGDLLENIFKNSYKNLKPNNLAQINNPEKPHSVSKLSLNEIRKSEKIPEIKVNVIYNPTKGVLADGAEAIHEIVSNTAVNEIDKEVTDKFMEAIKKGEKLKIVCHSQGAAITANALNQCKIKLIENGNTPQYLQKMMERIQVITIGGFASKEDFPEGVQILEISDAKDPIHKIAKNQLGYNPDEKHTVLRAENTLGKISNSIESKNKAVGNIISSARSYTISFESGIAKILRYATCLGNLSYTLVSGDLFKLSNHNINSNYLTNDRVRNTLSKFAQQDLNEISYEEKKFINEFYSVFKNNELVLK